MSRIRKLVLVLAALPLLLGGMAVLNSVQAGPPEDPSCGPTCQTTCTHACPAVTQRRGNTCYFDGWCYNNGYCSYFCVATP